MRFAARLATFGLLTALAAPAAAEPSDPAAAEALFRAARAAADKGDFATACPKFEESKRLDPTLGTAFNLADCDEHIGKLASAWQLFREVAQRLPPGDERVAIATARAATIEPRLPKLVLKAGSSLPVNTVVLRDGVEMGSASYDLPLPVDPGDHVILVKAPGRADRQFSAKAVNGQLAEIVLEPGAPVPATGGATSSGVSADVSTSGGGGRRTLGYVLLGVGGAALVTSGITGAVALSAKHTVDSGCDAQKRCSPDALDAGDRGRTASTIATVAFGAGVAAAAVGTFFIVSHGSDTKPTAAKAPAVGFAVAPGSAFVTLQGRLW